MGALERYRRVLGVPHVGSLWVAATLARLPIGINGLAIVLAMRHETGSFGAAGAAAGAYAAMLGLSTPFQGRLLDRYGPRRILSPMVVYHAVVLVAFVLLLDSAPTWLLVTLAGLSAIGLPPWGAVLRAMWPRLLGDEDLVTTAFALDAALVEFVFILGPLLVSLILVFAAPEIALLVSAALVLLGTFSVIGNTAIRGWIPEERHGRGFLGPLRSPGLLTIALASVPLGVSFGAIEIALPAFARHAGEAGEAGVLISAWGLGSAAGALVYGAVPSPRPLHDRWLIFTAVLTVATLLPLAATSVPLMIALVVPCGAFIAPALASGSQLMGILAPPGMATEAYAWGPTSLVVGIAVGNALAGAIVQTADWRLAVVVAVVMAGLSAATGFTRRRTLAGPVIAT